MTKKQLDRVETETRKNMSPIRKITVLLYSLFATLCIESQAQNPIKINNYDFDITLQDSIIDIKLSIVAEKYKDSSHSYFLLNDSIKLSYATLNGKKLKYVQKNDTLFFSTQTTKLKFDFNYRITFSSKENSSCNVVHCDTNQLLFERSRRWYPVLYDNFTHYSVMLSIPNAHMAFAYVPADSIRPNKRANVYYFKSYDEDFPLLITKSNIFQHQRFRSNNVDFNFYIIPRTRRLIDVVNNSPVYTTDQDKIDSLWNTMMKRSINAFEWYNTHLWDLKTNNLNFIEASIFGTAMGMGNFITMDRALINMETIDNSAFAHEISHLWLGIHTLYNAKGKFFIGESIPEYVNLMFYESWAGQDAFEKAVRDNPKWEESDIIVNFEQVLNQRNTDETWATAVIYRKGPAFVHEFRKLIGKDKLLKIIRETYSIPNHFITLEDFEEKIKENDCWNEYLKLYDIKL